MTNGSQGDAKPKDRTIFGMPGAQGPAKPGGMQQSRVPATPAPAAPAPAAPAPAAPVPAATPGRRSSYPPPKFGAAPAGGGPGAPGAPGGPGAPGAPGGPGAPGAPGSPGAPPGGKKPLKTMLGMPAMTPGRKVGGPAAPAPAPSARPAAPQPAPAQAPMPAPAAPAPSPYQPRTPTPVGLRGVQDQPLSKDGYAPTMMAYSALPPAPQPGQAPQPAAPAAPAVPTGPIPEPFAQAADRAAAQVGPALDQAAAQVGPALDQAAAQASPVLDQAAKDLGKELGALGAAAKPYQPPAAQGKGFDKFKKKKMNPLVLVGVGCALLLVLFFLLGIVGGIVSFLL